MVGTGGVGASAGEADSLDAGGLGIVMAALVEAGTVGPRFPHGQAPFQAARFQPA